MYPVLKDLTILPFGHIHRAQKIKTEWIRYAGSPLAYSFSEVNDKGITVVELKEKEIVLCERFCCIQKRNWQF